MLEVISQRQALNGRAMSSIVRGLSSIGGSDKHGGALVRRVPPSLRELAEKQQRTSREADSEREGRLTGLVGARSWL